MRGGGRGDEAPCDFSGWRPRCDDLRRVRSSCIRKGHLVWVNVGHSPTQRPSSATSPRLSTTAIEHTGTFKRHASERHDKSQSRTYIGPYTYIWGRIHVQRSRYPDRKGLLFVTSARLVCRVSALNYPDTRYDLDSLDEASKLAWKRPYARSDWKRRLPNTHALFAGSTCTREDEEDAEREGEVRGRTCA